MTRIVVTAHKLWTRFTSLLREVTPPRIDVNRLRDEIETVFSSVTDLVISRHCYNRLVAIVKANQSIREPNVFLEVFKFHYVSYATSAIFRQIDQHPKVISLIKLLLQIERNPQKIMKQWYASQYIHAGRSLGEIEFQENFGRLAYVDPAIVRADIDNLQCKTRHIKSLRHKRIAHYDRGKFVVDRRLDFNYLNSAISLLEHLAVKYYLLLHQTGHPYGLLPVGLEEEEEVFSLPWKPS